VLVDCENLRAVMLGKWAVKVGGTCEMVWVKVWYRLCIKGMLGKVSKGTYGL
jgi:hypothetical protein